MTIHKIEDRIRKLLRLADNNPAAEEAAAAFAQAQKLATKYALCIDDLGNEIEDEPLRMPTAEDIDEEILDRLGKVPLWKGILSYTIAEATMCRVLKRSKTGIVIFGERRNIQIARYMYDAISAQIDVLAREAIKRASARPGVSARSFGRSFRAGCASSVGQRLRETTGRALDEAADEARAKALGANALARIERAKDYIAANQAAIAKRLSKTPIRKSRKGSVESRAYEAGRFAGAKVRVSGSGAPEIEGAS